MGVARLVGQVGIDLRGVFHGIIGEFDQPSTPVYPLTDRVATCVQVHRQHTVTRNAWQQSCQAVEDVR
ncbi:hypothetical protein [Brachybacterium sacelli]|uniref:hypothetical protein n=1 Tax=Brachybacterium sacelli TaxID=173364 RepID=UPI0036178977